jgi:hypothetical protein
MVVRTEAGFAGTQEGRELAVLRGGPWQGCWYWRDDLAAQQRIARELLERCGDTPSTRVAAAKAHYRPSEDWVSNPERPHVSGRAWLFDPPAAGAR